MSDVALARNERGHFLSPHGPQKRAAVRADYETPELLIREIARKHAVGGSTIREWARNENWTMRLPRRVDPNDLVGRMLELLDGQIADLEAVMKNGATEVAMLSKLVTTLDRVLAMKVRSEQTQKAPSRRVQTLRGKVADRLAELNRD